ncbi:MAG: helix-turn-helix transcriptional regulator [Firmicutes bacterium]|nr:helix-turn-helix transcriptional regulator [Bacillota bacterium]
MPSRNENKYLDITKINDFTISYHDSKVTSPLSLEHYHDGYEIDFFVKANIQIFVKNIKYEINDGDALFISEYDVHRVVYNLGSHYARYVINFQKQFILNLLKVLNMEELLSEIEKKQYKKPVMTLNQKNELEELFKTLNRLNSRPNSSQMQDANNRALIKSYLAILLIRFNEILKSNKWIPGLEKKDSQVREIIHFIDSNFIEQITLELLEKKFYLSRYYISHIFKEITGFSVVEYIQYRRIIEAQKMLKFTDMEIIDIAHDCGFNNIQHFYRVFKKIAKVTPHLYRKYR